MNSQLSFKKWYKRKKYSSFYPQKVHINTSTKHLKDGSITAYETRQSSLRSQSTEDFIEDNCVTTVVFDLEHVLCTNIDAVRSKTEDGVMDMQLRKKQVGVELGTMTFATIHGR